MAKKDHSGNHTSSAEPRVHQRGSEIQSYGTVTHAFHLELEEPIRLEMTENVFRILAAGSFKLSARQGRMHAGGAHLEVGQFLDGLFRQGMGLEAENLAELHGGAFERLQFLAHAPGGLLLKMALALPALLLAKQEILRLVTQVTPGETQAEFSQAETAFNRAGRELRIHQSHPPFFNKCVAIFRQRSSMARVCSFPGERSCSQ